MHPFASDSRHESSRPSEDPLFTSARPVLLPTTLCTALKLYNIRHSRPAYRQLVLFPRHVLTDGVLDLPHPELPLPITVGSSSASWQPPPSVIPDSIPLNDLATAALCSPTRALAYYLNLDITSPAIRARLDAEPCSVSSSSPRLPLHPILDTDRAAAPTPPSKSARIQARVDGSADTVRRPPIKCGLPRADSEPLIRRGATTQSMPHPPHRLELVRSLSDGRALALHSPSVAARPTAILTSLQIHAPDPPVSCDILDPDSLVTPGLAQLAQDLGLERRFRPRTLPGRTPPSPLERGHWLVDCAQWGDGVSHSAWTFLASYIGGGSAGWGVWCLRDDTRRWLRVYCWGWIIGHIYLLLHVASLCRLKESGGRWVGPDGRVVLAVAGRGAPGADGVS